MASRPRRKQKKFLSLHLSSTLKRRKPTRLKKRKLPPLPKPLRRVRIAKKSKTVRRKRLYPRRPSNDQQL